MVHSRILVTVVLGVALSVIAQTQDSSARRMRADIEFLASPALEGRVSLGKGAEVAARFIAAEFRKAGLRPAAGESFLQEFRLVPIRLDREKTALRMRREGKETPLTATAVAFASPAEPVRVEAPVVFAGYGITAPEYGYDDYAGVDVKGKAALIFDHEPQEADPKSAFNGAGFTKHASVWLKTWNAQRHGAVAVLVASEPASEHRQRILPRNPQRASAPAQALLDGELRIPRFTISDEALEQLLSAMGRKPAELQAEIDRALKPASRQLAGVTVEMTAANREAAAQPSWNVAGLIEGRDPKLKDETVLLCAHYDHLGTHNGQLIPGANDNASGVAGLIELARRFAAGPRPKRSLLFVAFGSEEQIMLGSYYYAAKPLRPLETTRAVLNLDMIGRNEAPSDESRGAYDVAADTSGEINLVGAVFAPQLRGVIQKESRHVGLRINDKFDRDFYSRALFRCDHLPFLIKNVPAVWLFGGFHPGYHEPSDTVDQIDFTKLGKVVELTYRTTRALAGQTR